MLTKIVTYRAPVVAVVAFAVLLMLVASLFIRGTPLQASPASASSAAPMTTLDCTPDQVAVFSNRVHVHCTNNWLGVNYFAAPTSDQASAARYLSLFTTAFALGKTVTVYFTWNDTSGEAYGCLSTDCRAIYGVSVQ